jgi:hypothetical protein
MTLWKQPPKAKVYEAFSAVADGRVAVVAPGAATVTSSSGDKSYDVEWSSAGDGRLTITSNDNASYWQGYAGYPIIAVLLTLGTLHAQEAATAALAGVEWHALNKRFKRDYDAAVAHALARLAERGVDVAVIRAAADAVADELAALQLERPPRRKRPPGSG